jgi:hypothetical protein
MSETVFTLLILVMAAVLGVLFVGLFSMARGGEFNRKYGNLLMRLRVTFQAVAIGLFLLLIVLMTR